MGTRGGELLIPVSTISENGVAKSSTPTATTATPSSHGHECHTISAGFIFLIGIFMSSWLGASVLTLGEWFMKKMPLVSYIYSASKQISVAISPDQNSNAFKEVAIIKHPRMGGQYMFGFITSTVVLQKGVGEEELCCVYVPANHLYLGDLFLISSKDILRSNLSIREGIEIVISGRMSVPKIFTTIDPLVNPTTRIVNFEASV